MRIELIIPSTDNAIAYGAPALPAKLARVKRVAKATLCRLYGGTTETTGYGSWLNENDQLVEESVTILTCYSLETKETELSELAEYVKTELSQDCVIYAIDNQHSLV